MKKIIRWPILWWLRFWAKLIIWKIKPVIIGVTGSAGKSSAVAAIALVATEKFNRIKVAQKANSESGIPADILGLHFHNYSLFDWLRICMFAPLRALYSIFNIQHSTFDAYLVEMGVDEPHPPKNMGYLLTILKPDIAVILNVLPVHSEQFGSVEAIAAEKSRLITENQNLKFAILNSDQPEISSLVPANNAKVFSFGKDKKANVLIEKTDISETGTQVTYMVNNKRIILKIPGMAFPEYYGYTLASAIATGLALGITPDKSVKLISQNFTLPAGRGRIFSGIKQTTVIDSSYNASREPMIGSLKLLKQISGRKTKIVVLGDMRELGSLAKTEHQQVAKAAIENADQIILVGPLMKLYALPIIQASEKQVDCFETAGQAAKFLRQSLSGKEVILVKGSQNTIFLEIVVEELLANKKDINQLCRRGSYWNNQRAPYRS